MQRIGGSGRFVTQTEIDKGLSGAGSGGQTDSGVSDRIFGSFLSWLSDHESDVFVAATCNRISGLPPEFSRAERFDALFFFDLPTKSERAAIWDIYLKVYGLESSPELIKEYVEQSVKWTGAEIKTCCRLARMLNVPITEAKKMVTVIARTAPESLTELRTWASGRCLSTTTAGIYSMKDETAGNTGKGVSVKPVAARKLIRKRNDN